MQTLEDGWVNGLSTDVGLLFSGGYIEAVKLSLSTGHYHMLNSNPRSRKIPVSHHANR